MRSDSRHCCFSLSGTKSPTLSPYISLTGTKSPTPVTNPPFSLSLSLSLSRSGQATPFGRSPNFRPPTHLLPCRVYHRADSVPDLHFSDCIYESATWKQILAPGTRLGHTAICGGVIHWLSDENIVVGFDVYSEKMIKMSNAPKILCEWSIRYFGECGGRLILILDHNPDEVEFKILEMDKDDGSWTMECEFHALPPIAPYWTRSFSILFVVKEEEEKGYSLILALPGKIISYNLQLKTWNVLRDAVPGELICYVQPYATAHPYIESLSPV